jgi:CopG family transcriptional regulator, nickel-responsive regulator
MSNLIRFGISLEAELLESFDGLAAERGYSNRSEALRDLMRDALVQSRITAQPDKAEVIASLTLVYDHHARELTDRMAALQHDHHDLVISVLHVHISHDDCMEVLAMQGKAGEVRHLADALLSLKGVKHGKLFITLPGQIIARHKSSAHSHSHPPVKTPAQRRLK